MGSAQLSSSSGSGGTVHGLRLLARQVQHAASTQAWGSRASQQCAEDHLQDVRDLAQEGPGLHGRLRRRVLQHHRQVVGQFARRQEQAGRS
jgi:hypothetical protein